MPSPTGPVARAPALGAPSARRNALRASRVAVAERAHAPRATRRGCFIAPGADSAHTARDRHTAGIKLAQRSLRQALGAQLVCDACHHERTERTQLLDPHIGND